MSKSYSLDEDYTFYVRDEDGVWMMIERHNNEDEVWGEESGKKTCHILAVSVLSWST